MQRLISTLTLCLWGMLLPTAALASDAEDVIAAEMDSRVQEMAGNVDGYFKYKGSTYTIFPPKGGLLSTGSKREQAQARFDAGMVRRSAESEPERWNLRMTSVWVKEAGEWKSVHRHESHLTLR